MAKEIFPSSYECDCGHESHFFENTIKEMRLMSERKEVRLGDASNENEHTIVFYKGEATEIKCPRLGNLKFPVFLVAAALPAGRAEPWIFPTNQLVRGAKSPIYNILKILIKFESIFVNNL